MRASPLRLSGSFLREAPSLTQGPARIESMWVNR